MQMPDFYDEIKFLNSDWGLPKVLKATKWDTREKEITDEPERYVEKVTATVRKEAFKGNIQVITTTLTTSGTITAGGVPYTGKITDYSEEFSFVKDEGNVYE